MIIRHDLKLIFLHVPKCAGKELRSILLEGATPENHDNLFNFGYSTHLHRHVDLAHLPMDDLVHFPVYQWLDTYTVIAAIRNPYERLRSASHEYYRQCSKSDEAIVNSSGPSSSMRLAYLRALPLRHGLRDPRFIHSLPITWFTHHGSTPKVDHLLRCESLQSDFLTLAERLRFPAAMATRAERQLRNQPITTPEQFQPGLSSGEIQLANLLYAQDFQAFGYPLQAGSCHASDPLRPTLDSLAPADSQSHSIDLIARAERVCWHWGPSSHRHEPGPLEPVRRRQP